jgi:hypothetical protein
MPALAWHPAYRPALVSWLMRLQVDICFIIMSRRCIERAYRMVFHVHYTGNAVVLNKTGRSARYCAVKRSYMR